ncbi:MAG: SDR family oxidoreductase [Flammeovirgaceae bacterium]
MDKKVAIVTGSNRGIGFEICSALGKSGMHVLLTARNHEQGLAAAKTLQSENLSVSFHPLDVGQQETVTTLANYVETHFGRLDVLVNNAGIMIDKIQSIVDADIDVIRQTMEINFYGVLHMIQAFTPLLHQSLSGRIINISSGLGALNDMGAGHPGYRISKTSLNALTAILAGELQNSSIKVNAMCPGWVKTEMGGKGAPRSIAQGADTAVWLATAAAEAIPHGKFLRDRTIIDW